MAISASPGFRSWGTLAQPIHGILGAYPLVCFTGALVTDIAYANSANMQWANFSVWLIAGGAVMGVLAAIAGIADALAHRGRRRRGRARPAWHGVATIVMLVLAVINGFIHSRDGWTSVVPTGLILSAFTAVLALVTAWSGYALERETHR
jgi:uncharacterized membrane protein